MIKRISIALGSGLILLLLIGTVLPTLAAPSNDEWVSAEEIWGIPYETYTDARGATAGADDPYVPCNWWGATEATVWYVYTADQDMQIEISTAGSSYNTVAVVYEYEETIGWMDLGCAAYNGTITLQVYPGQTYYLMIGEIVDSGSYPYPPVGEYGGDLWLSITEFNITSEPYADFWHDFIGPLQVQFYDMSWDDYSWITGWYWEFGDPGFSTSTDPNPTFTYPAEGYYDVYLTVTTADGRVGTTSRTIDVFIWPIEIWFYYWPDSPSSFDMISFDHYYWDPMGASIDTILWDFGDGTTSTEFYPNHRYAVDGTYTVTLTITTQDGRVGTTSQEVVIATHDVGIKKFSVPKSAKAGQTRAISVGISNELQPELVVVNLYVSTADNWDNWRYVGQQIVTIPALSANRTTNVQFTYTFTAEDSALGKVNFKAEVNLANGHDAIPGDNTAISLPTRVSP